VPRFSTLNFVLRGSPNVGAAAKDLRPSGMTHPGGMIANRAQVILSPNGWMVPDAVGGAVLTCVFCSSVARNSVPARWQLPAALPTVERSCGLRLGAGLYSGHSGTILRRGYGQVLEHFLCPSGHRDLLRSGPDRMDPGRAQIWPQRFQPQRKPSVQRSLIWLCHE